MRNTFDSCEKFGRILHAAWQIRPNFSHVWGIRSVRNTVQQSLICYQEMYILLEVLSTDYSLSMGNFRGIFSLSNGWPLFLAISVCHLLEWRLSLHDTFVWQSIVFIKQRHFSVLWEKLHFGVKKSFLEISFFLGIFWSGVVGATDTFVAEHVANMLSWLKQDWDFQFCPWNNFKTWGSHFSDNQRENKTGGP